MDARLILAGRSPDFAGSMGRGLALRAEQNALGRQAAMEDLYQAQGPGIAAGDPGALNALAQFDPMAAQGMRIANEDQQFRREDRAYAREVTAEELEMKRQEGRMKGEEYRAGLDAARAAQEAEALERDVAALHVLYMNKDEAGYSAMVQREGLDPAQWTLGNHMLNAAGVIGLAETLKQLEPQSLPAGVVELQWRAQQAGLQPDTPEYQAFIASEGKVPLVDMSGLSIGGTGGGAQIGTIPQGFAAVPDATDPSGYRMMPIPGGPEDMSGKQVLQQGARDVGTQTIVSAAARAREASRDRTVGGFLGQVAANNPASTNADLYRQVAVLKSNATIQNLQAMREASPTGGALGSVTAAENQMLADKSGVLDPASPNFLRDLADYELTLLQVIHGPAAGKTIFDATRTDPPPRAGLTNAAPPAGATVADDPLELFQ